LSQNAGGKLASVLSRDTPDDGSGTAKLFQEAQVKSRKKLLQKLRASVRVATMIPRRQSTDHDPESLPNDLLAKES